jgi:hypothetical protein
MLLLLLPLQQQPNNILEAAGLKSSNPATYFMLLYVLAPACQAGATAVIVFCVDAATRHCCRTLSQSRSSMPPLLQQLQGCCFCWLPCVLLFLLLHPLQHLAAQTVLQKLLQLPSYNQRSKQLQQLQWLCCTFGGAAAIAAATIHVMWWLHPCCTCSRHVQICCAAAAAVVTCGGISAFDVRKAAAAVAATSVHQLLRFKYAWEVVLQQCAAVIHVQQAAAEGTHP